MPTVDAGTPERSRTLTKSVYENGRGDRNGLPARSRRASKKPPPLKFGSDVEIAQRIQWELQRDFEAVPYCEGEFWRYTGTHWEILLRDELERRVQACDGL